MMKFGRNSATEKPSSNSKPRNAATIREFDSSTISRTASMKLTAQNMQNIDPTFWAVAIACRGKCVYCGLDGSKDIKILRNMCLDHLVPRQASGIHDKENRVLSCFYCNRDCKGNYDPRKDAPELAGRKVLLKHAKKYVRTRQRSRFFNELYKALNS